MRKNNIKIRQAKYSEKKDILKFIKLNWKSNHILLKNNKLFDFYYKEKNKLNFLIAKSDDNIIGLLGFIKNKKYNYLNNSIVWTSILRALETHPLLGVQLVNKLVLKFKKSDIGCMGNNIYSQRLFSLIGFNTGILNQYFLINKKIKRFKLIKFRKKNLIKKEPNTKVIFININKKNISIIQNFRINDKNYKFIYNKYINNMFYNYKVIGILNENYEIKSLFVYRVIKKNKASVIRVVDYMGKFIDFKKTIYVFHKLLQKYNSECIDFFSSKKISNKYSNYINLNNYNKDVIIPNLYEPFVRSNFKIRYGILNKTSNQKDNFFKAEGDAERPNEL